MKKITKLTSAFLIGSLIIQPISTNALTKNETIYTNLDVYGNVEKSSVTNHLGGIKDTTEIEDTTELKEILNINGSETYTLHEERLTWNGLGRDIYYRGTITKDLPITTTIEYFLDGEKVDAKDILGKSGKIEMKIHFQNNQKQQNVYTPFVVTLGMILDNEENTNIEITNGKVTDTGTKNIIIGLAAPGMYENFNIKELESLDEISITYDTTNFSSKEMYMVATPKLLSDTDLKIFNKLDTLTTNLKTLQTSINTIESGAKKLESGSSTLVKGSNEITTNLNTALEAVKKLEAGSITLSKEINNAIPLLNKAAESIKNANLKDSLTGLTTLKNKNESAKNALIASVTSATNMDYNTLMTYYKTNLANYQGSDATTLSLKANCELILLLDANTNTYNTLIKELTPLLKQVESLTSYLKKIEELNKGVTELTNGLTQVKTGLSKLYEGSKTLTNGAKTLNAGVEELSTGITTFNKEGIQSLSKYGSTITNYKNKAKAVINASKEYSGFTSNNANNTTFVYKIEKVK